MSGSSRWRWIVFSGVRVFTRSRAAREGTSGRAEAVKLRRWDESAKIYGLQTPKLEHFRPYVEACLIGEH